MALAFKASMFTFLCCILPLFFKYPQDRYPAVRVNTYLVHCPFLWWPQQAFAEMEALLTPFYHEKMAAQCSDLQDKTRKKHRCPLIQPNTAQPGSEPHSEPEYLGFPSSHPCLSGSFFPSQTKLPGAVGCERQKTGTAEQGVCRNKVLNYSILNCSL